MRLIDADALQERLARMWTGKMLTNTKYHTFSELISAEPTINPVLKCSKMPGVNCPLNMTVEQFDKIYEDKEE